MEAAVAADLTVKGALAADAEDFEAASDEEPSSGDGDASGSDGGEPEAASSSGGEEEEEGADEGSEGWSDDELEAAPPGSGSDAEEEGEEGNAGAGGGGGSSDSDSEGGGGGRQQQRDAGFLEGGKSASFAKAFAMILEGSGKKAAEAARPTAAGGAAVAPILATSKSIAKRKAEDAEEQQADREAKKLRQEMKKRGHVVPRRRGQDPAADQQDKALARLATKGVVRLFNAIAKAQKQLREAEEATGSRVQAVKLGKASFLAQLKRSSGVRADGQPDQPLVPSAPARQQGAAAAAAAPAAGKKQQQQQRRAAAAADSSSEDEDAGGWDVLKQGFVGLQGGNKMKDWDRQASDEEGEAGGMGGSSDDE
ncbi:hypothetical protein CHLNCDRAFT_137629 [Chlorella variabilis]|uniref:RRP15-like protein n=1 Tax=Chlorella variabilis TaxID=554065 RepID=E1Z450_CHLVA|nr:hypothetical protein CHLNCDRAFT_137629 [Chlorella variabilis]EFN59288.1 hypothetical protein CHLNCDRAFT_137629 [Chlorella variabilis]|eukprot:XP_005851390.1 hypothetical protein CHLNCDRAFT_137629 [Chlorella variabilis]